MYRNPRKDDSLLRREPEATTGAAVDVVVGVFASAGLGVEREVDEGLEPIFLFSWRKWFFSFFPVDQTAAEVRRRFAFPAGSLFALGQREKASIHSTPIPVHSCRYLLVPRAGDVGRPTLRIY